MRFWWTRRGSRTWLCQVSCPSRNLSVVSVAAFHWTTPRNCSGSRAGRSTTGFATAGCRPSGRSAGRSGCFSTRFTMVAATLRTCRLAVTRPFSRCILGGAFNGHLISSSTRPASLPRPLPALGGDGGGDLPPRSIARVSAPTLRTTSRPARSRSTSSCTATWRGRRDRAALQPAGEATSEERRGASGQRRSTGGASTGRDIDHLSGDVPSVTVDAVTSESIGADQVWRPATTCRR